MKQTSAGQKSLLPFNSINSNDSGAQRVANAAAQGQGAGKQFTSAPKAGDDKKASNPVLRHGTGAPSGITGLMSVKMTRPASLPRVIDCILFLENCTSSSDGSARSQKHAQVSVDLGKIRSISDFWSYLSLQGPQAISPLLPASSSEGTKGEDGAKRWAAMISDAKILYLDQEGDWMKNLDVNNGWGTIMASALKLMIVPSSSKP